MQNRELGRDSMFAGLALTGKRFLDLGAPGRAETKPASFDVGYCPAALPADGAALSKVLAQVGELLLVQVRPGADWSADVERLATAMPHWALLPGMNSIGRIIGRASRLLAVSRDAGIVAVTTVGRSEALTADAAAVRWADLSASGRTSQLLGNVPTTQLLFADLRQQLSSPAVVSPGDVLRILKTNLPMMALACRGAPEALVDLGTDRYWWRFLEGLASFIESGRLGPENAYVQYLRSISAHGGYDPGMRFDLADASRAVARLRPRLAAFLEALTSRVLQLLVYNPIGLTLLSPLGFSIDDSNRHQHLRMRGGREFRVQCLDGNHRLAALWLGGADACPVIPMWTNVVGTDAGLESLIKPTAGETPGLNVLFGQTVQDWDSETALADPTGVHPRFRRSVG
jgi:hypothetical protein